MGTAGFLSVPRQLLVVTGLLVAACGGDDDDDSTATSASLALTADDLEAALLTPEEVGSGWRSEGAEPLEIDEPEEMGGRCPAGSSFTPPAAATFIDFEPPDESGDNTIAEGLLTFDSRDDLDAWTAALESCVAEPWEEGDDPVEHVSLETIDVAEHGDDRAGFLFSFAHGEEEETAHASRWFLVRVGGVLVLVSGEDYDLDDSADEELLTDVLARAVEKVEASVQS